MPVDQRTYKIEILKLLDQKTLNHSIQLSEVFKYHLWNSPLITFQMDRDLNPIHPSSLFKALGSPYQVRRLGHLVTDTYPSLSRVFLGILTPGSLACLKLGSNNHLQFEREVRVFLGGGCMLLWKEGPGMNRKMRAETVYKALEISLQGYKVQAKKLV